MVCKSSKIFWEAKTYTTNADYPAGTSFTLVTAPKRNALVDMLFALFLKGINCLFVGSIWPSHQQT
jgi:hypothetical protein